MRLDDVGLGPPVALNFVDVEAHADTVAQAVGVERRDVAEDAALDAVVLDLNGDGFADGDRAVRRDGDVADEIGDAFLCGRIGQRDKDEKECGERDAKDADQENETFGKARSAAFSISKNAACLKANHEAMMLDGTCSIITLKSRTVPL